MLYKDIIKKYYDAFMYNLDRDNPLKGAWYLSWEKKSWVWKKWQFKKVYFMVLAHHTSVLRVIKLIFSAEDNYIFGGLQMASWVYNWIVTWKT